MIKTFPTFEFELDNNVTYVWTPQDYLFNDDPLRLMTYCIPW